MMVNTAETTDSVPSDKQKATAPNQSSSNDRMQLVLVLLVCIAVTIVGTWLLFFSNFPRCRHGPSVLRTKIVADTLMIASFLMLPFPRFVLHRSCDASLMFLDGHAIRSAYPTGLFDLIRKAPSHP